MNKGFTLIELIVVLAIMTILMMAVIPSAGDLVQGNQTTVEVNKLVTMVNFARSAAVQRGEVVTICKSVDQKTCSGTWSDGQIVFVDKKASGKLENGDELLRVFDPVEGSLDWRAFPSSNYLKMSPNGFTFEQNGTFYYCPKDKNTVYARAIIIDKSGRARVSQDVDSQGEPLSCL